MLGEMLDTSPAARRFYYQHLARLSPAERMAMMSNSTRMVRRFAEAGIRGDHPGISAEELKLRVMARIYGREVVERILGPVPRDLP